MFIMVKNCEYFINTGCKFQKNMLKCYIDKGSFSFLDMECTNMGKIGIENNANYHAFA